MTYLKIKGQEASSWLKMVTRKMKLEVLPDTVHKLSPPQARKNCFIWMGHLYGAFGPGTTCWPGGGLKCSPGVGGSKMASRGVDWLLAPPTPTYANVHILILCFCRIPLHGGRREQHFSFEEPQVVEGQPQTTHLFVHGRA